MEENSTDCKDVKCFDEMAAIMMNNRPTSSTGLQFNKETWTKAQDVTPPSNTDAVVKLEDTDMQDNLPGNAEERIAYFYCPHCDYTTHLQTEMEGHVELFHKENNYLNWPEGMSRDTQEKGLRFHLDPLQTQNKSIQCSGSDFSTNEKNKLKLKPFACPHCKFKSGYKKAYKKHIEIVHLKIKPFTCPHCYYKTGHKNDLKKHFERVHSKMKCFSCSHCNYKTGHKNDLKKHIEVVHLKMKPFLCPHCDYRSCQKIILKKHVEVVHLKIKPFSCPHCYYKTGHKNDLQKHIEAMHMKMKSCLCPYCE